jgi:excisionase family DNA binding protein
MAAWANLHFPSIRIAPNRIRNYADWLSHIGTRGSTSHFRMSSAEVIRSRAQSNRGRSEKQVVMRMAKRESLLRPTMEKLGLTVSEAAALSSLGQTSIYKAIKERRLRIRKYGTRTIITRSDLASFLENLPHETEQPER